MSFSWLWAWPGTGPHNAAAESSFLNQDSGHSWELLSVALSGSVNESLGKLLSNTCVCRSGAGAVAAAEGREVRTGQEVREDTA